MLTGALAYLLAFALRVYVPVPFTTALVPAQRFFEVRHLWLPIGASQVLIFYFLGFYDVDALRRNSRIFTFALLGATLQLLIVTAWYFFGGDLFFPRSVLVLYALGNACGVAAVRLYLVRRLKRARPTRILLAGSPQQVREFLRAAEGWGPAQNIAIVGAVDVGTPGDALSHEGAAADARPAPGLLELPDDVDYDEIVLLSPTSWRDLVMDRLLRDGRRRRVAVVPSVYDMLVGRVSTLRLHDIPLIEVLKNPRDDLRYEVKRILDFLLGSLLVVALSPVMLLTAILVKATSKGPILYRQRRVGEGGREFMMWKFRTMTDGAEDATGPILATVGDRRMTAVGRWLRRWRLDELPQLFNVVNGTMSLVGPRPERPAFVRRYEAEVPGYMERFQVKPGLTGLAQVNGEYHTSPEYKLRYDLAYIYNYSLTLDLKIMAETIKVILTRPGV